MKLRAALPACLLAVFPLLPAAEQAAPLTLDPELYADALREVQGGTPPPSVAAKEELAESAELPEELRPEAELAARAAIDPGVMDWQAAMRDAGTELADVRLLALLQRLNPLDPPSARAEDYAAALRLHHLMLAGNARASLALASACRKGQFESGLAFIRSEALARLLEQRAAAFQLPLLPVNPQVAPSAAPQDLRQPGEST